MVDIINLIGSTQEYLRVVTDQINAWDIVQLVRTTNITYRSGPPGAAISPHGSWVVVGNIGKELLVAKEGTIVKVPVEDIRKVGAFSKDDVIEQLKTVGTPTTEINMVDIIAREYGWDHDKARHFLVRYNLPSMVHTEDAKLRTINRVVKLVEGGFDG